ncbi:MAG: hypothetical protein L0H23_04980 [Luteimonas sp.]|nr:hypothetical protein [Luteimonas sp.]
MQANFQGLSAVRRMPAARMQKWPAWLARGCLLMFAGCDRAPAPATAVAHSAPAPADAMPVAARAPGTPAWKSPGAGCSVLEPSFSSPQGAFRVLACLPGAASATREAAPKPVELRFQHLGPDGEATEAYALDADAYSAITEDPVPRFWDGHLLTLLLQQERGGLWLIGNWTGHAFVVTPYAYATGDEDGIEVAWRDDGFLVTTEPEGQRRVVAAGPGSQPGQYANESVACSETVDGVAHALRLGLDTDGSVIELEYSSAFPAGDGTSRACLIQARRGDSASDWARSGNGDITVDLASDDDSMPGSQLRIHADEGLDAYTVDLDVIASAFCGQSDAVAREVVLKVDAPRCASIRMPDHDVQD